jgi:hypothetical protein
MVDVSVKPAKGKCTICGREDVGILLEFSLPVKLPFSLPIPMNTFICISCLARKLDKLFKVLVEDKD